MQEYDFSIQQIFSQIPQFNEKGINELQIHDKDFSHDKSGIIKLVNLIQNHCPDLFVSLVVDAKTLDREIVQKLSEIYCSIEIPMTAASKNGTLLFDKKLYSGRAGLLNDAGVVFGFSLDWGLLEGDTFKSFRERLDLAVSLYPNHINFAQLEAEKYEDPASTGIYSSKDMDFSRGMAFACSTFYTYGRAVPWFNSVLAALKINATSFFSDFEEFQLCNNCSFEIGFKPQEASHKDIEKLQLAFLNEKFEEKKKHHMMAAVEDLVKLNGAFSRLSQEGIETELKTSYFPDDILSPYALDLSSFCENVTMEESSVKIFNSQNGPDYKIL